MSKIKEKERIQENQQLLKSEEGVIEIFFYYLFISDEDFFNFPFELVQ